MLAHHCWHRNATPTADLNIQDNEGNTPLHYAVENNAVDTLSCLLKAGANTSILNNDQNGPIHLAVQLNRIEILEVTHAVAGKREQ